MPPAAAWFSPGDFPAINFAFGAGINSMVKNLFFGV
jgi:hypothetical protein